MLEHFDLFYITLFIFIYIFYMFLPNLIYELQSHPPHKLHLYFIYMFANVNFFSHPMGTLTVE